MLAERCALVIILKIRLLLYLIRIFPHLFQVIFSFYLTWQESKQASKLDMNILNFN